MQSQNYIGTIEAINDNPNFNDILASWKNGFLFKKEQNNQKGLRSPQMGAIYASLAHWEVSNAPATIVMPTGTGKTEVMLSLIIAQTCHRTLIIVPTDALRTQIYTKVLSLGLLKNADFGLTKNEVQCPIVGLIKHKPRTIQDAIDFVTQCNVVISTISIVGTLPESIQTALAQEFSHLFVDEAHHTPAKTWYGVKKSFKDCSILQFTATPFRNDRQPIGDKIIFNYPLRKAQEENYFKPIHFIPITEWDPEKADIVLAERAVEQLRSDCQHYDHILMARVNSISRAEEIYNIYQQYEEYHPQVIHSKLSARRIADIKNLIVAGECKIIICVDMFGEGFDLPRLKIAAFHDIKKSLPTTLQLVGRFTRTNLDNNLGEASIIVNIADTNVNQELEKLYASDSDWNSILPYLSEGRIDNQMSLRDFIGGFENFPDELPIQNIRPALSAVIYSITPDIWHPEKYEDGLPNTQRFDKIYYDYNPEKNTIVIVTGKKSNVGFGKIDELSEIHWTLYVIYRNPEQNLLYINCSDNGSLFKDLAKAITNSEAALINAQSVFRCLGNIYRLKVNNVGLKEPNSILKSFSMHAGRDVEPALSPNQQHNKIKSNEFVTGYDAGQETSVGCSYKGRVWSQQTGNLDEFVKWCNAIGTKILDESIDDETVMRQAAKYVTVEAIPHKYPLSIEWPLEIIGEYEKKMTLQSASGGPQIPIMNCDINLIDQSDNGIIQFAIISDSFNSIYELRITNGNAIVINHDTPLKINLGGTAMLLSDYFMSDNNYPTIRFADGSNLRGNVTAEYHNEPDTFKVDDIQPWDWTGIDIHKESQGANKESDSIQYKVIEELKNDGYDIIFDDDSSGEIADIITIKVNDETQKINIGLYHLKFSQGEPGHRINDLYAVCGQAQKCISWLNIEPGTLISRMLRRAANSTKNRYEIGDESTLNIIWEKAKWHYKCEYQVYIVQPGLSKLLVSQPQLQLLSVTQNYLWETRMINLGVIASR